jgi:CelD/BcsL family acetyltransferase involved in cellulose biosynthesis
MQFTVISTQEGLNSLEGEWNDLLNNCSASHVPFLRHEYLNAWWQTLGGGEWEQGDLFTVAIRNDEGLLRGIAPLFFTKNRDGLPALMLLGSIEISDYLDLIIHSEDLPAITGALLDYLDGDQSPDWQVIDLYNILEDSPTLPLLKSAADKRGWRHSQERLQPCPQITLPGDWDTYLAGINKKQRHEIRRKMRRAENYEQPVRWYIVEDEDHLDSEIDGFLSLMAQDPEKERFLTEVMRTQMRAAVHAAFKAGWLQLSFLEVEGAKAAGYLNFDYADRVWVYNSGINFELGRLSPGWVLLGYLLKWANENQRITFDFMRGDEPYKYRFGGVDRFVTRTIIER